MLYIIKVWTVGKEKIKYAGLCKGFTNLLSQEATNSDRALYLVVHHDLQQIYGSRQWVR